MLIKPGRINLEKSVLYFVLITAFFNDWMRYKSSNASLFRIVIIAAIIICMRRGKVFLKTFFSFMVFLIFDLVLNLLFACCNPYGILFSLSNFAKYAYFYFCIFAVICVTYTIYELDKKHFQQQFFGVLKIIAVTYMIILFFEKQLRNYIYIANINDYGAFLTAIFPVFFYEMIKNKKVAHVIFCVLTYILLFIKDCKLDLLGVVLESGIMMILLLKNSRFIEIRFFSAFFMIDFIVLCVLVVNSPLKINGYPLIDIIKEPIHRILSGTPYETSGTSALFRTNVIILGVEQIRKNFMIGIGAGNAGKLFRELIPSDKIIPAWINEDTYSLHNAWMEFFIEFGIVGILFIVLVMKKICQIFRQKHWMKFQIITITTGVSAWVWIMAPSGILTCYYLICLFAGLFIVNGADFQSTESGNKRKIKFTTY